MIGFIEVSVGEGSPLWCGRCQEHLPARFRPVDEVRAALAGLGSETTRGRNLLFGGTDAFLHPALPQLVRAARDIGAHRIAVLTAGGGLSVGRNAHGAIEAGVRTVVVPILAGTAEKHDALVGVPGAFAAMNAGLTSYLDAGATLGIPVAAHGVVPLCAHNSGEAPGAVTAAARSGVVSVEIRPLPGARVDVAELHAAADTGLVNSVWVSISDVDVDTLGPYRLHASSPIRFEKATS